MCDIRFVFDQIGLRCARSLSLVSTVRAFLLFFLSFVFRAWGLSASSPLTWPGKRQYTMTTGLEESVLVRSGAGNQQLFLFPRPLRGETTSLAIQLVYNAYKNGSKSVAMEVSAAWRRTLTDDTQESATKHNDEGKGSTTGRTGYERNTRKTFA